MYAADLEGTGARDLISLVFLLSRPPFGRRKSFLNFLKFNITLCVEIFKTRTRIRSVSDDAATQIFLIRNSGIWNTADVTSVVALMSYQQNLRQSR
jgi:hypothetical protein